MPFDQILAERIRSVLKNKNATFEEKKMMGGLTFMVNDKMCLGVLNDKLMARVDPDIYEHVLTQKGARQMDFTGRPMKGFVFVEAPGIESENDLNYWIQLCLDYNPKAKSSKKHKK